MAQKKETETKGVKIQDLAPSKDAKGGVAKVGLNKGGGFDPNKGGGFDPNKGGNMDANKGPTGQN